jgi:hypothetical protein
MPRTCTVCASPRRVEADSALIAGEAVTVVAARLGLSPDAVDRHARNHLRRVMAQVRAAIMPPMPPLAQTPATVALHGVLTVHGLASRLGALVGRAEALLQDAETDGSLVMRGGAIRELRATLVDALKAAAMLQPEAPALSGAADDMATTIADRLLEALADHPEARRKAAQALAGLAT